ncbi:hypothetical protein ABQE62_29980 [Mycolicibacterium fortuitum]
MSFSPDTRTIHVDDQVQISIIDGCLAIRHTYDGLASYIPLHMLQ